jgi:hypothetical protein
MKTCVVILGFTIVMFGCRSTDKNGEIIEDEKIAQLKENDTLALYRIPGGLATWLEYYKEKDKDFSISHFKASGVSLHFGDLPDAIIKEDESSFSRYFEYAPDSSRYLDLFSYDHFIENGTMVEGEADQQVILADRIKKIKKQLMYTGPSQSVDFADWTGKESFILGITNVSEDGKTANAQIMLFRLTDSSFTNFDLDHSIPWDSMMSSDQKFSATYINKLKNK